MLPLPLAGRVALVTGAADERSIGWGIARALAAAGAAVVVNDIAPDQLAARVQDLEALGRSTGAAGRRGLAVQADISDPAAVRALFARAVETFGHIDIVASNAGIIRWESLLAITPKNLHAVIGVNLLGSVYVCRAAAEQMIAQGGGGRLILTSSVQSDMQFPITPIYGATKKAMHTLVGTLALELAPHQITVNHIGPGWVRSALNDPAPNQQSEADLAAQQRSVPLHRAGTIEEMGRAVVYFAGDDGAYCTGAFLRIDGGLGISKYSRAGDADLR